MSDKEFFTHLYQLASQLNKTFSLGSLLRVSLEKTVELLKVNTGWIWLTEPDNKSVYLAASYNLPPALRDHPERLSGWCYCIKQYFEDDLEEAKNISEITCSRLLDIASGTEGLKYHASIPIRINRQKVGIINLLSKENEQFDDASLKLLNAISDLVGNAIQRTRINETSTPTNKPKDALEVIAEKVLLPRLKMIIDRIEGGGSAETKLEAVKDISSSLHHELENLIQEKKPDFDTASSLENLYPSTPLTNRELEVLMLVKDGRTNAKIGEQLHISERTVKFHVTSILSKLHAKNRTEAVDICLKRGLIGI